MKIKKKIRTRGARLAIMRSILVIIHTEDRKELPDTHLRLQLIFEAG